MDLARAHVLSCHVYHPAPQPVLPGCYVSFDPGMIVADIILELDPLVALTEGVGNRIQTSIPYAPAERDAYASRLDDFDALLVERALAWVNQSRRAPCAACGAPADWKRRVRHEGLR